MKSKVLFTRTLTPERVIDIYNVLGVKLDGNIGVKVHSGEEGNQNFLRPEFLKPMIEYVNGTVIECNTAYPGARNTSEKHKRLFEKHGWYKYFPVDLMDEDDDDLVLDISNGKVIKKDYVGSHLDRYDSILLLSHFKGHPMGGFGGALKQLSIGCASRRGKAYIHGAGSTEDADYVWSHLPEQDEFLESMADAASSVHNLFKDNIVYINVMKNMSVDCDCCEVAEDPCMKDIGILASTDPVAIDKACIDLVTSSNDEGREHFLERVNSRHGTHTIDAASDLGFGTKEYELIEF